MSKNRYNNPRRHFAIPAQRIEEPLPEGGAVTMHRTPDSIARWTCPRCGGVAYSDRRILDAIEDIKAKSAEMGSPILQHGLRCHPCNRTLKLELLHDKREVGLVTIDHRGQVSLGYVIKGGALLYIVQDNLTMEVANAAIEDLVAHHEKFVEFIQHCIRVEPFDTSEIERIVTHATPEPS